MAASAFRFACVLALLFALVSTSVAAQTASASIGPSYAGDCAVAVTLAGQRTGDVVQVQMAFGSLQSRALEADDLKEVTVSTGAALQKGDTLRLLINGVGSCRRPHHHRGRDETPCEPEGAGGVPEARGDGGVRRRLTRGECVLSDGRSTSSRRTASVAIRRIRSRNATTAVLFGVNFDYRAIGSDTSQLQFWLAGETMHGVRSADVDCTAEENKPAECNPAPGVSYARAVLANSTSVEAYVAPRLVFWRLQKDASAPTSVYCVGAFRFHRARRGAARVQESPRGTRTASPMTVPLPAAKSKSAGA